MFFTRVLRQYWKYGTDEVGEDDEVERDGSNASSRRPFRSASIKNLIEFVDKKEEEVLKKKKASDSKQQHSSRSSDGQSSSP